MNRYHKEAVEGLINETIVPAFFEDFIFKNDKEVDEVIAFFIEDLNAKMAFVSIELKDAFRE